MTSHRITFTEDVFEAVRGHLLRGEREEVALLYAHEAKTPETAGLIVRRWEPVPPAMLVGQEEDYFAVDSGFIVSRVKQARAAGESVLLAHSHPGDPDVPRFSRADDRGEDNLYPLLRTRIPGRVHGAVVFSPGGQAGRLVLADGTRVPVDELRIVGRRVRRFTREPREETAADEAHARQFLLWGSAGQGALRGATIGIVGAGGTGSIVAQQLIHLGVGAIIAIDPQPVAASNLSRIAGARRADVGVTPKVEIVARTAREVDPDVAVRPIRGDVAEPEVLATLKDADLIFLCTDSHRSRLLVNALAVQYAIPTIDLGFLISVAPETHRLIAAIGDVRVVVPGGYCLACVPGLLSADRIKAEKATPEERAANPGYFLNLDVADPSVITLNSTIASLAVTLGCDMLVPTMRPVSLCDSYRYHAVKGIVTHVPQAGSPSCGFCSAEGRAARGDAMPLPQ